MDDDVNETSELRFLGQVLGSHSGWDQLDEDVLIYYEVELNELGKRVFPSLEPEEDLILSISDLPSLATDDGTLLSVEISWEPLLEAIRNAQ